jgi:hypothetical protein
VDRVVFVSSATFTGGLGGVRAADQTCSDLAVAAGLAGIYRAWLSDDAGRSPSVTFTRSDQPELSMKLDDVVVETRLGHLIDAVKDTTR